MKKGDFFLVAQFMVGATFLASPIAHAASTSEFDRIHTITIVSALGDTVDMQTQGTSFDYADYKLRTDWSLDVQVQDYVTHALQSRFTIKKSAVDPQIFANIKSDISTTPLSQAEDRIAALPVKPNVDAIVVVLPYPTDSTGYVSPGFDVTYGVPFLFNDGTTWVAVTYEVYVLDAKTGQMIDYGSGKIPASNMLSGHSPPWAQCSNSMWADSEDKLSADQKTRIRTELWSLLTRSLPYALSGANLVSDAEAGTLAGSLAVAGDVSCHRVP